MKGIWVKLSHGKTYYIRKTKAELERDFYLKLSIKERYGSYELERQINNGLFKRSKIINTKTSVVLREIHHQATNAFKDNYILEFLSKDQKTI
ncbi:MAG: hypothetical protein ISR55_02760 [Bacteroidetes bacterium]|nr:hypothetical protein [Bacteroidota bacterium]